MRDSIILGGEDFSEREQSKNTGGEFPLSLSLFAVPFAAEC